MGMWDTFRNALGLTPPLRVAEPGAFALSEAARETVAGLGDDRVLFIQTTPAPAGRRVQVEVRDLEPGWVELEPGVMTIAAEVSQLAGLELDTVDGRYKVTTHLELRGRETPNPEGRLYLVSRPLAYGRPRYFRPGSEAPALAHGLLDGDLIESILIRDNTLAVVRRSGVSWDAVDAHVDRSLRRYFLHCGMALVPSDDNEAERSELEQRVQSVLEEHVRPRVHRDGGDVELIEVRDGIVRVHMVGACSGCPASALTLKFGIEQTLKDLLPGEVHAVEQVG